MKKILFVLSLLPTLSYSADPKLLGCFDEAKESRSECKESCNQSFGTPIITNFGPVLDETGMLDCLTSCDSFWISDLSTCYKRFPDPVPVPKGPKKPRKPKRK